MRRELARVKALQKDSDRKASSVFQKMIDSGETIYDKAPAPGSK